LSAAVSPSPRTLAYASLHVLETASSTSVGTHEQQDDHDEKQKNERAYERAAGETENDQGNDNEQK
jgi:hypothetical protein